MGDRAPYLARKGKSVTPHLIISSLGSANAPRLGSGTMWALDAARTKGLMPELLHGGRRETSDLREQRASSKRPELTPESLTELRTALLQRQADLQRQVADARHNIRDTI